MYNVNVLLPSYFHLWSLVSAVVAIIPRIQRFDSLESQGLCFYFLKAYYSFSLYLSEIIRSLLNELWSKTI